MYYLCVPYILEVQYSTSRLVYDVRSYDNDEMTDDR
jgi:hypothetical protein